jgi:hypothetical protein
MMGSGGTQILAAARALIALLIAVSLTLTPLTAARAMHVMTAGAGMTQAGGHGLDCHKAKHHNHRTPGGHDCCGDHSKSKCPEEECACLFKCGAQTLAIFAADEPIRLTARADFHSLSPAKPPGARPIPAGPPPRV